MIFTWKRVLETAVALNTFFTGKMEKPNFEIPIFPQTLNINNYRTTGSKYINLDITRKLIKNSLKRCWWTQCLLVFLLRYFCLNLRRCCHKRSGVQGSKELNFQWKVKRYSAFVEINWKVINVLG